MITFFTTAKKFEGKARDAQINAIRSWLRIHQDVEIVVFEEPKGLDICSIDPRITIDPLPENVNGIPRVNYMFQYVSEKAKNPICCFINCDIILSSKFKRIVSENLHNIKGSFLAMGQRYDFENEWGEWSFEDSWESKYLTKEKMKLHPPAGSDYFLFKRGQYPVGSIPPLIVGRPGWDLWMIYNACKLNYKTIDLSLQVLVYHQNHDYSHKVNQFSNNLDEPESKVNLGFLPENGKFDFTLLASEYVYTKAMKLTRSFSRGNRRYYLRIASILGRNLFVANIRYFFSRLRDRLKFRLLKKAQVSAKSLNGYIKKYYDLGFVRLNVGAGCIDPEGPWIKTDLPLLDVTSSRDWCLIFDAIKLETVLAEHVWEHLTPQQAQAAHQNIFQYLKPGGRFRVAVPDGFNPDNEYLEHVRPGGTGPGAEDHKLLYNYQILSKALEEAGFTVELLEYWDENGTFHFNNWDPLDGMVKRSKRFDPRNQDGKLAYTSLIIDALKP